MIIAESLQELHRSLEKLQSSDVSFATVVRFWDY